MKRKKNKRDVALMDVSEIVCNCNSVTKGTIIEAVRKEGLITVDQVKECTKASGSCGGCKRLVSELLNYIKSNSLNEVIQQRTLCSCTNLTEEEVIGEIHDRKLSSVPEVIDALDWKQQDGCQVCRGAINYFLGMIHPDYRSFRDEHIIASIQIDGTYLITAQMCDEVAIAGQLKKIATITEKYQIPNCLETSGQKIRLSGIKKEILPSVFADLSMALSPLRAYTIQSVRSNIDKDNCQCLKLPSLHLASELEKQLGFLTVPYFVSMSVSACIHNGNEAVTNDIELIGMDRGWEIHVGRKSSPDVNSGEIVYVAETCEEALEMILAFVQYYRESAHFLEPAGQWVERIGLIHIREVLFDTAIQKELLQRIKQDADKNKKSAVDFLLKV